MGEGQGGLRRGGERGDDELADAIGEATNVRRVKWMPRGKGRGARGSAPRGEGGHRPMASMLRVQLVDAIREAVHHAFKGATLPFCFS